MFSTSTSTILESLTTSVESKQENSPTAETNNHGKDKFYECISNLLSRGANINAQDDKGDTVLMRAVKRKDLDAVISLLKHNPDITLQNNEGETAVHIAAKNGDAKTLLCLLKQINADITKVKNNKGKTPIILAAEACACEVLDLLWDHANKNGGKTYVDAKNSQTVEPETEKHTEESEKTIELLSCNGSIDPSNTNTALSAATSSTSSVSVMPSAASNASAAEGEEVTPVSPPVAKLTRPRSNTI